MICRILNVFNVVRHYCHGDGKVLPRHQLARDASKTFDDDLGSSLVKIRVEAGARGLRQFSLDVSRGSQLYITLRESRFITYTRRDTRMWLVIRLLSHAQQPAKEATTQVASRGW